MERLHIIADVSHLSDKGFWDIAEHSTRPFAASHSNCRALAPHCRNLTDEMIRVMAEKGGLVGLNYCAGFLDDQPSPDLCRSTTALMAKHAAHFKQVGGIEIIGLGSDFDGIGGKLELSDCSKMPLLADALRKEGFTEDEVEAIFFRNAQRFFENNLNVSETSRKLFVHRNTLVYRLEKIKKLTGLDLREFEDAIVFKVALMVKKYLNASPTKY